MNTTDILQQLPSSLGWMVLFRLDAIRPFADDSRIRAIYYLPHDLDLTPYSHVVLTSAGHFLAPRQGVSLIALGDDDRTVGPNESLYRLYRDVLTLFPPDDADCLGFGMKANLPPVLLHLLIKDAYGEAKAVFRREPLQRHYELLSAIGVEYLGGEQMGGYFVASYRNKLPVHLHAGALAHFSRTGNCNEFFLNHGEIDSPLEAGLIQASEDRTKAGLGRALAACALLARRALAEPPAMICCPPPPNDPFPYGDLVPLGFLLRALNLVPAGQLTGTRSSIQELLLSKRNGELWAFHTGRLVTATDSVLILRALPQPFAIEALERFSDGSGGYYPQLWSSIKEPGRMVRTEAVSHWCQSDFGTTCLVRGLRAQAGLAERTPLMYLEERFEQRSALYFANPYLVDWALAEAIRRDERADELKARLLEELLASRNDNFSFGLYDIALSTALAILTMAALGYRGRVLRLAQLRLLEMIEPSGVWAASSPFYSSCVSKLRVERNPQFLEINGTFHELSLYRDEHRMIGTALAAEALAEPCSPEVGDIPPHTRAQPSGQPSGAWISLSENRQAPRVRCPRFLERYRCHTHAEYISEFALPAYAGELVSR